MIDPRIMADPRRSAEERTQLEMAMQAQQQQLDVQRHQQKLQCALQIVGMDVSRAMIGYVNFTEAQRALPIGEVGATRPEARYAPSDQVDQDFVALRKLACEVLSEFLTEPMPGAQAR